jgi:hypothetical protein
MTIIFIFISGILYILFFLNKNKNQSYPQRVVLKEILNPDQKSEKGGELNGNELILSREANNKGINLIVTIKTKNQNIQQVKKIIISWSEWPNRIFNFNYENSDKRVEIKSDVIRIDIGPFNNCPGSINFLKRTSNSKLIIVDLLNYLPEIRDFDYENHHHGQICFSPLLSRAELLRFKKGRY